jgi:hypothetical protein
MSGVIGGIREADEPDPRIFEPLLLEVMNPKESKQIVRKFPGRHTSGG